MAPPSCDVLFPVPNRNLVLGVINSNHLNRIVAEHSQFIAEDSFNIIWRGDENEWAFSRTPPEEKSWDFFTKIPWFFVFLVGLDLKLSFDISKYRWLQEITGLLNQTLKIVSSILLLTTRLFLKFLLFNSLISTYIESNFPSFVFFSSNFSQDYLGKSRLLHNNTILWIFAPRRIVLHVTLLSTIYILFKLYFAGSPGQRFIPNPFNCLLDSFWQLRDVDWVRSEYPQVEFPILVFLEGFFGFINVGDNYENSWWFLSLFEHKHLSDFSLKSQMAVIVNLGEDIRFCRSFPESFRSWLGRGQHVAAGDIGLTT